MLLSVAALSGLLALWLAGGGVKAGPSWQDSPPQTSPAESPVLTPTPSPSPSPTPEPPTPTPTKEAPPTATPTSTPVPPTATPGVQEPQAFSTLAPGEAPTATSTPTPTPLAAIPIPPPDRPVTLPSPTPPPDPLLFAARVVDSAVNAALWIWFVCGSLVLFIVAGIVVGLGLGQRRHRRELYTLVEEAGPEPEEPEARPGQEESWPSSLP